MAQKIVTIPKGEIANKTRLVQHRRQAVTVEKQVPGRERYTMRAEKRVRAPQEKRRQKRRGGCLKRLATALFGITALFVVAGIGGQTQQRERDATVEQTLSAITEFEALTVLPNGTVAVQPEIVPIEMATVSAENPDAMLTEQPIDGVDTEFLEQETALQETKNTPGDAMFLQPGVSDVESSESEADIAQNSELSPAPVTRSKYLFTGITNNAVNVRAEATQNSERLDKLQAGTEVYVLRVESVGSSNWYEVDYGEDKHGFVSGNYVDRQIAVAVLDGSLDVQALAELDVGALLECGTANNVPQDGEATVAFEGIGVYSGAFVSGKRSGNGTFLWENGDIYEGEWLNDRINGIGRLVLANGVVYEGQFSQGRLQEGSVILSQTNGTLLERSVADGKLRRRAKLTFVDGTTVEGDVSNQRIEGQVTIQYANGDIYEGAINDGLKSGNGTYTWTDGARYAGSWKEDQMSGKGTYYFSTDEKIHYIVGKFEANQPAETMTYISIQGIKYETEWENGNCISICCVR